LLEREEAVLERMMDQDRFWGSSFTLVSANRNLNPASEVITVVLTYRGQMYLEIDPSETAPPEAGW
jgi:hypothetical protein